MRNLLRFMVVFVGFSIAITTAGAQTTGAKIDDITTIAVLPWVFEKGTEGAMKTAKEFTQAVMTKARIEVISEVRVDVAWIKLGFNPIGKTVPSEKEMLKLGQELGTTYVMAGKASWNTRSKWIGLGPKTKSDCTTDIMIVNVNNKEVVLRAMGVHSDSTAKEDGLKAAGAILLTPLFTVVSGGPKTPHEQRAVQLTIAKALDPWLVKITKNSKIDDKP